MTANSPPSRPQRGRPRMPRSYGISKTTSGTLGWDWAVERLEGARTYWICTTRPDGRPHVMPVWAVWLDGAVYFATGRTTRKARNLVADPRIAVHLESGDEVVILEGIAREASDDAELTELLERYQQKYGVEPPLRDPATTVYRLAPEVAFGWREKDFPTSATRWLFEREPRPEE